MLGTVLLKGAVEMFFLLKGAAAHVLLKGAVAPFCRREQWEE